MKQLMLGNKALARGLYEAGCCVVSSYPGTPSTEVTEEAAKYDEIYCHGGGFWSLSGGQAGFLRHETCGAECGGGSPFHLFLYRCERGAGDLCGG